MANELRFKLNGELEKFIKEGRLIIGICNGFQILVKAGLLPGHSRFEQEASLIINDSAKFEARWVYLRPPVTSHISPFKCVWTEGLPEIIYLPVAHGEGKLVTLDKTVLRRMKNNGQVVFQYCDNKGSLAGYPANPNGSQENIAGICDETGRIFGLMPHPERHISYQQHPRRSIKVSRYQGIKGEGDGLQILRNGVEYAKTI